MTRPFRFALLVLMPYLFCIATCVAQDDAAEKTQIEKILTHQADAWNDENLERFMETYWKSEQLTFSSGGKTTRGWQTTLDRYKKNYPSGNMGRLHFDNLETTLLSDESALVLGHWHLTYPDKNSDGNFSLVLKKFENGWKIIHDHSSIIEEE